MSQNWLASHSCYSGHDVQYFLLKGSDWFKYTYKAWELKNKLPGCKTTRIKKCPLTKNCDCWVYSQIISCRTGVVGTRRLHFRNIQVLFITEKISFITRTPRNCRCWVSFHFTVKWCILFTANKDFLRKYNLWRNCNGLETTTTKKQKVMNENIIILIVLMVYIYFTEILEKWSLHLLVLPGQFKH